MKQFIFVMMLLVSTFAKAEDTVEFSVYYGVKDKDYLVFHSIAEQNAGYPEVEMKRTTQQNVRLSGSAFIHRLTDSTVDLINLSIESDNCFVGYGIKHKINDTFDFSAMYGIKNESRIVYYSKAEQSIGYPPAKIMSVMHGALRIVVDTNLYSFSEGSGVKLYTSFDSDRGYFAGIGTNFKF